MSARIVINMEFEKHLHRCICSVQKICGIFTISSLTSSMIDQRKWAQGNETIGACKISQNIDIRVRKPGKKFRSHRPCTFGLFREVNIYNHYFPW